MTDTDKKVDEKPKTDGKHYMLLTRAVMDGAIRDVGYIFTLKPGQLGPIDNTQTYELDDDGKIIDPKLLYEEVKPEALEKIHEGQVKADEEHIARRAEREREEAYHGGARVAGEHGEAPAKKAEPVPPKPKQQDEIDKLLGVPAHGPVPPVTFPVEPSPKV